MIHIKVIKGTKEGDKAFTLLPSEIDSVRGEKLKEAIVNANLRSEKEFNALLKTLNILKKCFERNIQVMVHTESGKVKMEVLDEPTNL